MIPELRKRFNRDFSDKKYSKYLERLDNRFGAHISFRVCETPFFVPKAIQEECERAAIELTFRAHDPAYLATSDATLHPEITVASQSAHSLFTVVDFAL